MNANEYQDEVMRTAGDASLAVLALGVAGEAGEVADIVKKHLGHGHDLDRDKLADELGDVLWYIAAMGNSLDIELGDIMKRNVEKLRLRYPDGFSIERSLNREA